MCASGCQIIVAIGRVVSIACRAVRGRKLSNMGSVWPPCVASQFLIILIMIVMKLLKLINRMKLMRQMKLMKLVTIFTAIKSWSVVPPFAI